MNRALEIVFPKAGPIIDRPWVTARSPARIFFVGDDRRLIRWIKRIQKHPHSSKNPTRVHSAFHQISILLHGVDVLFAHPDEDLKHILRSNREHLGGGVAISMLSPDDTGETARSQLITEQINELREFLDSTDHPMLLFGPDDVGVGQMVLSRLPLKRYAGMKERVNRRLKTVAKSLGVRKIPSVAQRAVSQVGNPTRFSYDQRTHLTALTVLNDLLSDRQTKANARARRIDEAIPDYAWDLQTDYLQAAFSKLPSMRGALLALKKEHLRMLAAETGQAADILHDAVFHPAFDMSAFLNIYDPDRRCLAKFVENAARGFDIRRASLKLSDERITTTLGRRTKGLGFYSNVARREFTLLLLLPSGEAWQNTFTPTRRLLSLFSKTVTLFGNPSVCFRDQNGLIATWMMKAPIPDSKRLTDALELKIKGIATAEGDSIQVRPKTSEIATSALLLPDASAYVRGDDLLPAAFTFPEPTVDPVALFGPQILQSPSEPKPKTVHKLDDDDRKLMARIVRACPGGMTDRARLQQFLEQLIPHLRDLEKNPKKNHCHRKGPNVFAIPVALLNKWGYRNEGLRLWLESEQIFVSGQAYASGGESLIPKATCYQFNWRALPLPDDRSRILKNGTVAQLAAMAGLQQSMMKKYRKNPASLPLRIYLRIQSAIRDGEVK